MPKFQLLLQSASPLVRVVSRSSRTDSDKRYQGFKIAFLFSRLQPKSAMILTDTWSCSRLLNTTRRASRSKSQVGRQQPRFRNRPPHLNRRTEMSQPRACTKRVRVGEFRLKKRLATDAEVSVTRRRHAARLGVAGLGFDDSLRGFELRHDTVCVVRALPGPSASCAPL